MITKITIKTWAGEVYFEHEMDGNSIKETVKAMLKAFAGKWMNDVNLSGQDLSGIDFSNSKFDNSTFYNSTFDNSKFDNSTFDNSTFDNSTFYNSKFDKSTFDNSTFDNSTFYNSKFDKSSAEGALKSGAFESIRMDFFGRMLLAQHEVPALRQAIVDGNVSGSSYEGPCCCFVGTIAKAAGCYYKELPLLKPNSESETEKWFFGIQQGYTPENNEIARITVLWIDEFLALTQPTPTNLAAEPSK